jgi:hypothetical protein
MDCLALSVTKGHLAALKHSLSIGGEKMVATLLQTAFNQFVEAVVSIG